MTSTKNPTTGRTEAAAGAPPLSPARRGADRAYAVLAALFVLAVLVQVYLAGLGAFGSRHGHGWFDPHEALGNALGITGAVLLVLALIARAGRWTVIGALVVGVLTEVAQHGLAAAGHGNPWIGGLHAFDGMLILGLGVALAVTSWRRAFRRAGRPADS
jgi:hypothetical protein